MRGTDSLENSDAGKDWRQEEKRMTDDKMVEWHHWLNGHEFEQALEDHERQGSLACYSPRGCKESDMNWVTEKQQQINYFKPSICMQMFLDLFNILYSFVSGYAGSFTAGRGFLPCYSTQTQQLPHTGFLAAARRLSCPVACGILVPRPGIELVFPAL